jgi:hypothetical protein
MPTGNNKQSGGSIFASEEFRKIISIGYELECGDMLVTNYNYITDSDDEHEKKPRVKKFLIPRGSDFDYFLHNKKCSTDDEYSIILSSETDAPLGGTNETHSFLYDFEQQFLQDKQKDETLVHNNALDLLQKGHFDIGGNENYKNIFVIHTELLFTIFNKSNSCENIENREMVGLNDPNCILNTLKKVFKILDNYFVPANIFRLDAPKTVKKTYKKKGGVKSKKSFNKSKKTFNPLPLTNNVEHAGMRLTYFKSNWNTKPIYYVIPTFLKKFPLPITPRDIKWVPQMTYCVKIQDIISVTKELSKLLYRDDLKHVTECIELVDELMRPVYYEKVVNSSKKGSVKIKKRDGLTSEFIIVCEKIKNVLFFALYYYYCYYFYSDFEGKEVVKIGEPFIYKNLFCFILRHSIFEIITHYLSTNPTEISQLKNYLNDNVDPEEDNENIHATTIDKLKKNLISYVSNTFYWTIDTSNEYTVFSKVFESESNYFPFDAKNEQVLIEFRCFHKNIIQSYSKKARTKSEKKINVHRTLDEWREIIHALDS